MFTFTATPTLPLRITFATASAGRGVLRAVTTAYNRRRNRSALRELLNWNDRMLADIGLMREDVRCVLATSRQFEPSERLHVMAIERRATALADARRCLDLAAVDGVTLDQRGMRRSRDIEEA